MKRGRRMQPPPIELWVKKNSETDLKSIRIERKYSSARNNKNKIIFQ